MTTTKQPEIKVHLAPAWYLSDKFDKVDVVIGIDCGVKTGYAAWAVKAKKFYTLKTCKIHEVMAELLKVKDDFALFVKVEDARQVRFKTDANKAKGAGSVCRDAKIWEDFLTDYGISFEMVRPSKALTKWDAKKFQTVTGYTGKTDQHGRDAAMLVYGY